MRIKQLFPKFNRPILFEKLGTDAGQYWYHSDSVVLDIKLRKCLPGAAKMVFLHEMIHATAHESRLNRWPRLEIGFGTHEPGSKSWRVEECIAELATMVCAMKLGMLNQYTNEIMAHGLRENYGEDIYVPWREVVAAVRYFARDDEDFTKELAHIKRSAKDLYEVNIQDTYIPNGNTAA